MVRSGTLDIAMDAASAAAAAEFERQELLQRIATLEQRITDLESTPCCRIRRRVSGASRSLSTRAATSTTSRYPARQQAVTYQRERVYRRQTINEKIEEALEDADEEQGPVGVDAAIGTQFADERRGLEANKQRVCTGVGRSVLHCRHRSAHDILRRHRRPERIAARCRDPVADAAQRLHGAPGAQNEINLREAWLRTELFGQRLALTAGRLDLTNYFDQNAFANDESTQFISDALVNNQMLGLASNGTGVAAEFDPKTGLPVQVRLPAEQHDATNLSDSMYTLSEVGYTFTPFALPEGSYRVWFRTDNTRRDAIRKGVGLSLDQKLTNVVGLFARYGTQEARSRTRDHFYSVGLDSRTVSSSTRRIRGARLRADGSGIGERNSWPRATTTFI